MLDRLRGLADLYRRTTASRTAVALVVANLVPLVGVLFLGWSLWTILILYWLENGIVGFWNVPRMLLARGSLVASLADVAAIGARTDLARELGVLDAHGATSVIGRGRAAEAAAGCGRVSLSLFFLVHYGLFWLVHGVFVFALPSLAGGDAFGDVAWPWLALPAVALFVSHGWSFVTNYLRGGEYLVATPLGQMARPYGRVVILHLTIVFGAVAIAAVGAPIILLVLLVLLKTAFDLALHLREHAGRRPAA